MPTTRRPARPRFTIEPCGDPYNRRGVDVCEHTPGGAVYRGDISPAPSRRAAVALLRRAYPGCRITHER